MICTTALAFFPISPANLAKSVNLIIFFGLLAYLLRKPVAEFFQTRFAEIRATLDRAAREKEAATAKLQELDARMQRLDAEMAEIRAQSEHESAAESERIAAAAQADAEKLRLVAQREINSAKQSALVELRQFAAAQSVELAEQLIRRELTPEDDARLVRQVSQEMQTLR